MKKFLKKTKQPALYCRRYVELLSFQYFRNSLILHQTNASYADKKSIKSLPKFKAFVLVNQRLKSMMLILYNKTCFHLIFLTIFCFFRSNAQLQSSVTANDSTTIHLADPTIFHYKGMYYLYGTVEGATGNGFLGYRSADLKAWKRFENNNGYALKKGDAFGTSGFWAPQIFLYNNKFYMAYVANENIAIAESDAPLGPFRQAAKQPLAASVKQIDPFVFIDDDRKKYLYHVRLTNGNKIFVAELNDDFSSIKTETLHECITATEKWENTTNAPWPVTEGPTVIKHKDFYYLFYSANDFRNPDYAVGYAISKHPLGPWQKYAGNPIIHKGLLNENGTGHGDFFKNKKQYFYVFHTHYSKESVRPRKTAIVKAEFHKTENAVDHLAIDKKSFYFLSK